MSIAESQVLPRPLNTQPGGNNAEWERKQRAREYRVAARREKRNRKSDEKKQRKLNATILRRMTRNPDKYTKNAERNSLRKIEAERRKIWAAAIKQAQQLAAIHDPTGTSFNVGPVTTLDNGSVVTLENLRRRHEREAAKQAKTNGDLDPTTDAMATSGEQVPISSNEKTQAAPWNGINTGRLPFIMASATRRAPNTMSKTQQKKLAALEPRPPPSKPTLPDGITLPDGEENWLALWDLSNDQLERRVLREKRRKAAERKALRVKQKAGKGERRAARDEKRRVYRELKLVWKGLKEEEKRHKTKLTSAEQEEERKIAVEINTFERKAALDRCAEFGMTVENTPGTEDVKPKALGMKGVDVDFDALEIGQKSNFEIKPKNKRIDLGAAPKTVGVHIKSASQPREEDLGDFIRFDIGEGQEFERLNYNNKLRRKLRRAIESATVRKELLVRERLREHCKEQGLDPPPEIDTAPKPKHIRGQRTLENGTLETAKQERVRSRLELTEFNRAAKVLRRQAKQIAMEAGLRIHAELTGKLPQRENGTPIDYTTLWDVSK